MAQNAVLEVLSTPELIALILTHLPMSELLLTAPLVSLTFHLTILSTPSLQEALFLRPTPESLEDIRINPFLLAAFPTHFAAFDSYHGSSAIRSLPWSRNVEAFRRKEASWRKMLLWNGGKECGKRVKVMSCVHHMSDTQQEVGYLEDADWVRMGAVWDVTRSACKTDDEGQFCLKWRHDVELPMRNIQVDRAVMCGRPHRIGFFRMLRNIFTHREHRRPIQTRYVALGNRLEEEKKEEKDVLEIWLSAITTCVRRDVFDPPPPGLGEDFQSEGSEKVEIAFGDTVRIAQSGPNPYL